MDEPTLQYRIWQRGMEWHWQVMSDLPNILASGIATSSVAARTAALSFCLDRQGNHPDTR
jgi:hypothetical protein